MNKTSLGALLFAALLPAISWAGPIRDISIHVLVEGEAARVYAVRAQAGKSNVIKVAPGYQLSTTITSLPDGIATASVTLSKQSGGTPSIQVGESLKPAQSYEAYFVICTTSPQVAGVGGIKGQMQVAIPDSGIACSK